MLLPHEVIHALATCKASECFQSLLMGNLPPSAVTSFWEHVKKLPPWMDHPVLKDAKTDLSKLIGVQLHADGAEFFRDDEIYCFSWSSIFATQGTISDVMLFRFPLLFVAERHMQNPKAPRLRAFSSLRF